MNELQLYKKEINLIISTLKNSLDKNVRAVASCEDKPPNKGYEESHAKHIAKLKGKIAEYKKLLKYVQYRERNPRND